jgi:[acyl-carrier-protein] S-malonyltransferase
MAKKIALLFSGQGAQTVGMGKDLSQSYAVAANLFAQSDTLLGRSLSQIAFEGPIEELTKTSNCQLALFIQGIALLQVLKEEVPGFHFEAAAGLSLGEFTAHCAAGSFDFLTGLQLVQHRSRLMEEACHQNRGTMAAFVGGEESVVREIASACDVDVANLNAPGQIVLSGPLANIEQSIAKAKESGVRRSVQINVGGAFHSRLMEPAKEGLTPYLTEASIQSPTVSVVANATAQPVRTPEEIRTALANQVTGSVRWTECVTYLIDELGCDLFLELGPNQVLAGLISRIRKDAEVISIGNLEALQKNLSNIRCGVKGM